MTDRQSTHGPGCWSWGPKHYDCAVAEIERLREELSKMRRGEPSREEISAIVGKHFQLPGNVSGAYAVIAEVLLSERMRSMAEDAERYRWLRDLEIPEWMDLWHQNPYRIDAAIDQARGKGGKDDSND